MKKTFKLENLECAHCAAKMEKGIQKIDGVESASISFMTAKLTLEAPEEIFEDVLEKAAKICKKVEPDCEIVRR